MTTEAERPQLPSSRQPLNTSPFPIIGEAATQPSLSNPTAVVVATSGVVGGAKGVRLSLSSSLENENASAARELLRNVQQDDEIDLDSRRRRGGRRSPLPSQVDKRYAKMGILFSVSPEPTQSTATLPARLSPRFLSVGVNGGGSRGPSPVPSRPVSYHDGMGRGDSGNAPPTHRSSLSCISPSESTLDFLHRGVVTPPSQSATPPKVSTNHEPMPGNDGGQEGLRSSPPIHVKMEGGAGAQVGGGAPPGAVFAAGSAGSRGSSASSPDSGYGNTPEACTVTTATTSTSTCTTTKASGTTSTGAFAPSRVVSSTGGSVHVGSGPEPGKIAESLRLSEAEDVLARNRQFDPEGMREVPEDSSAELMSFAQSEMLRKRTDLGRLSGSSPELILATTDTRKPGEDGLVRDDSARRRSSSAADLLSSNHTGSVGDTTSVTPNTPFPYPPLTSPYTSLDDGPRFASEFNQRREAMLRLGQASTPSRRPPGGGAFSASLGPSATLSTASQSGFGSRDGGSGWAGRPRSQRVDSGDPVHQSLQEVIARRRRQRAMSQPLISSTEMRTPPPVVDGKDFFQVTDELGKENSHFMVSEALLAVIEQYKANCAEQRLDEDAGVGGSGLPVTVEEQPDGTPPTPQVPEMGSSPTSQSSFASPASYQSVYGSPGGWSAGSGSMGDELSESMTPRRVHRVSLLELMQSPAGDNSAESTAQRFLQHVARHLTGNYGEELSVTQTVLQLPTEFLLSLQMDEDLQKSVTTSSRHMRGNREWAPPRAQVIFHVKTPSRSMQKDLVSQGYRCTGCGMKVDHVYFRYFRFCHYTGKYFCQNCHMNATAVIPAHVIRKWSFKRFVVSNFARDLLAKIHNEPIFNVRNINAQLYTQVPIMAVARELRRQLVSVKEYLRTCRRAESLNATFEGYAPWTTDVHTYSMEDFIQLKNGTKMKFLRSMLIDAIKHVKSCPLCQGKGFVCEYCMNVEDIIYPFDIHKVTRCKDCRSCFHQDCYKKTSRPCPRCTRIKERQKQRQAAIASTGAGTHDDPPS